ncbi:hypothetical protein PISMIDRAFT_18265 [Pisolithus microcarpus 441]|uniref:hAT-like transposase RNase-H fold domain-containing protein n=1 Tax=Pisolithus microcarpus 441 TaxID=765257 RepID=A0A0C9Y831_9AGAM|nr:hypothetical protein PISMIDRAFT_18265 [Pisolithus microcarpus 441]
MDNASNNDSAMKELSVLLSERDIDFDPEDRRIMCFPHVLNICTSHVLKAYTQADFTNVASSWIDVFGKNVDKDAYMEALENDPVALGRNIVCVVRASNLRRESFRNTIITGNKMKWFTDENNQTTSLPVVELLRDVRTRWDSVYFMINRLWILDQALDCYFQLPANRELQDYKMNDMDWQVLQDVEVVLEILHAAQQSMSGESTPKLGGTVPAFETFMEEWKRLSNAVPHCAAYIKPGLVVADTYYKKMGKMKVYVVAMFVDPTIRMTWVNEHWSSPNAMEADQVIKDLMTEYRASGTLAGTAQSVPADQVPCTFPKPKLAQAVDIIIGAIAGDEGDETDDVPLIF